MDWFLFHFLYFVFGWWLFVGSWSWLFFFVWGWFLSNYMLDDQDFGNIFSSIVFVHWRRWFRVMSMAVMLRPNLSSKEWEANHGTETEQVLGDETTAATTHSLTLLALKSLRTKRHKKRRRKRWFARFDRMTGSRLSFADHRNLEVFACHRRKLVRIFHSWMASWWRERRGWWEELGFPALTSFCVCVFIIWDHRLHRLVATINTSSIWSSGCCLTSLLSLLFY